MLVALLVALIYTLPNFFPEGRRCSEQWQGHVEVDQTLVPRSNGLSPMLAKPDFVRFEGTSVKHVSTIWTASARPRCHLEGAESGPGRHQLHRGANLLSRSPSWLSAMHALPMFLGLDLRGGVYFLMQVDMKSALVKKAESLTGDIRTLLRDKNIRHTGISRDGNNVAVRFRDTETLVAARNLLLNQLPDLQWQDSADGSDFRLVGSLKPEAARLVQTTAITQNITTLHNRVNELGVAEPVIQQQGRTASCAVARRPGHREG